MAKEVRRKIQTNSFDQAVLAFERVMDRLLGQVHAFPQTLLLLLVSS